MGSEQRHTGGEDSGARLRQEKQRVRFRQGRLGVSAFPGHRVSSLSSESFPV